MTTTAIGNRRSPSLLIIPNASSISSYGSALTEFENEKVMSDFRRTMNTGYGSTSISIINRRQSIVHASYSIDTSSIIMKPPSNPAAKNLLDAFHLLESDATIRKVVMSKSTDYYLWNFIARNKAVQELHSLKPCTANEETTMSYTQEGESASQIIKWLFPFKSERVTEFIEKIKGIVFGALQCLPENKNTMLPLDGVLEERVRSPILLPIVLIMVVFVTTSMENS